MSKRWVMLNLILGVLFSICLLAEISLAGTIDILGDKKIDQPCYIEDFLKEISLENLDFFMPQHTKLLLPYFIYSDKYFNKSRNIPTIQDCFARKINSKRSKNGSLFAQYNFFKELESAVYLRRIILDSASFAYQVKYGSINRQPIDKLDIPEYENRAKNGDILAMHELRRYYEYPSNEYNPEQTQARFWLFKAIEEGDEGAMLEAGYDRPYSVRSELKYNKTTIAIDVACDGIDKSGQSPYPGCFLYNLMIDVNSEQTGYLVLDSNHLSGNTIRPQEMAIVNANGNIQIQLTSFADKLPNRVRKDYFSLNGIYLGSDHIEFSSDYFWNFRGLGTLARSEFKVIKTQNLKMIQRTKIRTLPYAESFLFWEMEYPLEKRLKGLDHLMIQECFHSDTETIKSESCKRRRANQDAYFEKEEMFFARLNKFFPVDPYAKLRLSNRAPSGLSQIEMRYSKIKFSFMKYPCGYHPPRTEKSEFFSYCNYIDAFNAYEKFDDRPTYIIEKGSNIKSIRMLQVCRYFGNFKINHNYTENQSPCYATQIRVKTQYGYTYHYVVNKIEHITGPQSKHMIGSSINMAQANLIDKKNYIILSNVFDSDYGYIDRDQVRVDVFDDEFHYIGSNNPILSNSMISGYKPLPNNFIIQLKQWVKDRSLTTLQDLFLYFDFVHPLCGDIIIEQRRRQKSQNIR